MEPYLENICLMTYDFAGSWDSLTAHQAPMFYNPKDERECAKTFNVTTAVDYCLT